MAIRSARALLPALLAALLAAAPAAARAAPPLHWSGPQAFDSGRTPSALSCASESLCVAVDRQGYALSTSDPTAASPSWRASLLSGQPLNAISCAPEGLCAAVDAGGEVFVNPAAGSSSWTGFSIDGATALTGVSCPSASLCVAVDEAGNVWSSSSPGSGSWSRAKIDASGLRGVSCSSTSLCVAVDDVGDVLASGEPNGGGWRAQRVDFEELTAVSCAPGGPCVAADGGGDALASADATGSPPTWSLTAIDGQALAALGCASASLCVAVDGAGQALASDDPASTTTPSWSSSTVDSGQSLTGVSCLPGGFCLAVDAAGRSLAARVPEPAATTLAPTEVTSSSALLAGAVDSEDAALGSCTFEYGIAIPYEHSIACSALPAASDEAKAVSAALGGLAANTAYHYRLRAASPAGTGAGADEVFTTAVSSQVAIVYPQPSITGTPAVNERLTCHAGTPAGTSARLSYVWLRDQIPIAGSTEAGYTVKGQDSGHHLQCQVTASDGGGNATARSAFVSVPSGGVPAAAGETYVGAASFRRGSVSVPVTCSPHASRGCSVYLRLAVVETLSGRRIVAVAARGDRGAHASAALRHRTVTIASARARIPAGAQRTVTASLGASARRLLGGRRRFSAYLYVSGTVIGVIEAQLSRQLLTLAASGAVSRATRVALSATAPAPAQAPARATKASVLAATPYMGWDTYLALGGNYSESTVLEEASQLISLGLEKRGYRYVWLDVGWWHGTRAADGQITVSAKQWPHGLEWLTRTLHAAGLLVGLYTDAGPDGCGGAGEGSYGHYQQDANTFAAWGFDAVKVDFCGGEEYGLNPAAAYAAFHAAIAANSSHRPMLLSICNFLQPEQYGEGRPLLDESAFASYTFGPSVGNSWRTDTDVGVPGSVSFTEVLRNLDADAAAPQAAGPGHWNDPDYLAPDQGMSATQFDSQLSMWAMLAAPLMISDDLRKIGPASLAAVRNGEVIAIDQDPAGVQGTLVSSAGDGQVWVKPLLDGSRAVALLNRGPSALKIQTSARAIGLPAASTYDVRNVWTHELSSTRGSLSANVPGDGTVLLRVAAR